MNLCRLWAFSIYRLILLVILVSLSCTVLSSETTPPDLSGPQAPAFQPSMNTRPFVKCV